jgi:hypothetical protein
VAAVTTVEAMAERLGTPEGQAVYQQHSHVAETPLGHAKHNLGACRFNNPKNPQPQPNSASTALACKPHPSALLTQQRPSQPVSALRSDRYVVHIVSNRSAVANAIPKAGRV